MKILELGSYVAPAYAGMLLAEQNNSVTKWVWGLDPIQNLKKGDELWEWINYGKIIVRKHASLVKDLKKGEFDAVIDNFTPSFLHRCGIDPHVESDRLQVPWVSLRSEIGDRSFDIIAQARSILEFSPWIPFYVGDTSAGLWMAFKILSSPVGHHLLGQASCLQKLVEGELVIDIERNASSIPWDSEAYYFNGIESIVSHKGQIYSEPVRDREWKLANLWHQDGRIQI